MKERIEKDIELFEENIKKIKNKEIKDMATRYYKDAKYYLDRQDYFTSFGCINYAHGLIDSILNKKNKIIEFSGSAGSGKTSIIERIIERIKHDYEIAVIIANFVGDEDSKRIEKHGIKAINVNTGNKCMDEEMLEYAIREVENVDYIFVENVGSLTCPFIDLKNKKIVIVESVQGSKIVKKFPLIFQTADLIIINKIDLKNDVEEMIKSIKEITDGEILTTSAINNEGIEEVIKWIKK